VMGRRTGRVFEFVKMSFDGPAGLLESQKHSRQLIAESEVAYDIPAGAFFCSNYLDSQLSYFDVDMNDDDPRLFDFEALSQNRRSAGLFRGQFPSLRVQSWV
jgi:hypothetical protein